MYKMSVCVKDKISVDVGRGIFSGTQKLVIGDKYQVKNLRIDSYKSVSISKVRDIDGNYIGHFYSDQFCSIEDWREKQINEILNEESNLYKIK